MAAWAVSFAAGARGRGDRAVQKGLCGEPAGLLSLFESLGSAWLTWRSGPGAGGSGRSAQAQARSQLAGTLPRSYSLDYQFKALGASRQDAQYRIAPRRLPGRMTAP